MIDIREMSYSPSIREIGDYIGLPLFEKFCQYMDKEYQAICKIGQRWLMIDVYSADGVFQDVLKLIRVPRECK